MQRAEALEDLDALRRVLEERFAYLKLRSVDHRALLDSLSATIPMEIEAQRFGLSIQRLLAYFGDSHAGVNVKPHPTGYLPFLVDVTGDGLVAFSSDRTRLLDADRPYLRALDGVCIERWLEAATAYVPSGSPQFMRRGALVWLRAVQMLRSDMGLPLGNHVTVTLSGAGHYSEVNLELLVTTEAPQYGPWPRLNSQRMEGNVGYLRLERMHKQAGDEIRARLGDFREAAGLIVDVRGNGGGGRDALLTILPLVLAPDAEPKIVNVAAYRLNDAFPRDHLAARNLFPVTSDVWGPTERSVIDRFMRGFEPEWSPPEAAFSEWHVQVVNPAPAGDQDRWHGRPMVILSDPKCFSATDVFLSALKGEPGIVIVGEPSGGGSARAQRFALPNSGLSVQLASMASFQASGDLYDGRGVEPDVTVAPEPEYFVTGGRDAALERALEFVRSV